MKYKTYLFITLLFFSSCVHKDKLVELSAAAPQLTINQHYEKKLNLRVTDEREDKNFIGFNENLAVWQFSDEYKNPNYADNFTKLARLNTNQDLSSIVLQKLLTSLDQKGLQQKRFTINQLRVEILEFGFISTAYRDVSYSKIKVTASNKYDDLTKIYDKQIIRYKPMLGLFLGDKYHNRIVNECLNQNIQSIINDNLLWDFLN